MDKLTLHDLEPAGKRVLVRVDFNVPVDETGRITDDRRIRAALPTIRYLADRGAKVILCSHFGRPKGKVVEEYRLDRVAQRLSELLEKPVAKVNDCIGEEPRRAIAALKPGDVLLLENVRFYPEEEKNDPRFARELASLADLYVNDAFGAAHRAHASTAGVAAYLPAAAGFLLERELEVLGRALENPERPFVALLGGKKVEDKIGVIDNLLNKVDALLIGGGMAYTFLKAQGYEVGSSLVDEAHLDYARRCLDEAARRRVRLLLPVDVVVAQEISADAPAQVVAANAIPPGWMGLDIGPRTAENFSAEICGAKTAIWNGPVGVFELEAFSAGTLAMCQALSQVQGTTIIGGGDSAAAVEQLGFADRMTHISTGGGASLEFLEGRKLPGVEALSPKTAAKGAAR
ncbi:MAG TPA: phosphoglycerate kinase [Firmicutes bacterium]|nr:phosphoglycerate kinase [Bacillota bacterium]